jgi:hypothetical protein
VYGISSSSGNYGFLGSSTIGAYGNSESGYGVCGNSPDGFAVVGFTTNGYAIYGYSYSTNGMAGYFGGDVLVTGQTTTEVLEITGGSDLSERFEVKEMDIPLKPGMLVSIDPETPGNLAVSREAYDKRVAGVISGAGDIETGMLMGQRGSAADGAHPVALSGRVYCMADASFGSIEPGDMLTTSSTPGHAMKAVDSDRSHGTVIGKAMSTLEEGQGLVLVLVNLQ